MNDPTPALLIGATIVVNSPRLPNHEIDGPQRYVICSILGETIAVKSETQSTKWNLPEVKRRLESGEMSIEY